MYQSVHVIRYVWNNLLYFTGIKYKWLIIDGDDHIIKHEGNFII
jgi:hypothetical protein